MNKFGRTKRTTSCAALVAAGALLFTACGNGDSSDVAAVAPADAPAAPPGEVPAQAAEDAPATVPGAKPADSEVKATEAAPGELPGKAPSANTAPRTGGAAAEKTSEKASGKARDKASGKTTSTGSAPAKAPAAGASAEKAAPITSGTITVDLGAGKSVKYDAVRPIKMVWFNFGSGYTYTEAITQGALERAKQLGVQLDVKDAQVNPVNQINQMQTAITSNQYVGGFVLPIAQDLMCDIGTNLAPKHNFMLVVTNAAICGRYKKEGEDLWSPGTLAFDSADQELSDFTTWGEWIRTNNPGPQKVVLVVGPPTVGQSENTDIALREIEKKHPEFDIIDTVYTDFTQQKASAAVNAALISRPETTIVASIYSELTKASSQVIDRQGKSNKIRLYDIGADSSVLPLIKSGKVHMSRPYYPRTMGATAVQAIYDARVGRKPIQRFYDNSGRPIPAMQGKAPMLAVTRENVEEYIAAGLSEY